MPAPSLNRQLLNTMGWFWRSLEDNRQQMLDEARLPEVLLGGSAVLATTITAGYLIWLIKGGQIVAAVMANLPAWRLIDPLPILNSIIDDDEEVDDSLDSIIQEGTGALEATANDQPIHDQPLQNPQ